MINTIEVSGSLELDNLRDWYSAEELNLLLIDPELEEQMYWKVTGNYGWEELESTGQIPEILRMVTGYGDTFGFEGEEPASRYAQGARLDDGNFMLELAVVDGSAYNMRIAYGPDAENTSSAPDDDVARFGPQSLSLAQVHEVLTSWVLGRGLPDGYGGSIHIYG
ncbi:hypothetical protein [Glutamicibacter sp. JC586]|uniref:hypothetical protein n=1 Tax=Glutamicibacter sp. JC586 TaxID=2590552 RepID=UPI00135B44F1|nr:hypothetical protein [Glutamicibacter sp. JC586]